MQAIDNTKDFFLFSFHDLQHTVVGESVTTAIVSWLFLFVCNW